MIVNAAHWVGVIVVGLPLVNITLISGTLVGISCPMEIPLISVGILDNNELISSESGKVTSV
jgi:hypothetical protein